MMDHKYLIFMFTYFIVSVCAKEPDTYKAAVVAYYNCDLPHLSTQERIDYNTKKYLQILDSISEPLDIILYPEATLDETIFFDSQNVEYYTTVPDPEEGISPCDESHEHYPAYFKDLSCAAKTHEVYMAVNILEKEKCDPNGGRCAQYGYNLYNTAVVFSRTGVVVARYRKYHLYMEGQKNTTDLPTHVIVETDFGVTFGIFICADILYEQPVLGLVNQGIKHLLFPTLWFSELPFLTALQAQQMWAQENNVVLLAANGQMPKNSNSGSGIYVGRLGPLEFKTTTIEECFVIVADIPKDITNENESYITSDSTERTDQLAKNLDTLKLYHDEMEKYQSIVINMKDSEETKEICVGEEESRLCCIFKYKTTIDQTLMSSGRSYYTYHMVAFSGVRHFETVDYGLLENCGIVACLNSDVSTCGKRFPTYADIVWPLTFGYIKVEASYPDTKQRKQYPNSLLSSIRPINPSSTIWSSEIISNKIHRKHHLNEPQNRLMTFAIYGRDYSKD